MYKLPFIVWFSVSVVSIVHHILVISVSIRELVSVSCVSRLSSYSSLCASSYFSVCPSLSSSSFDVFGDIFLVSFRRFFFVVLPFLVLIAIYWLCDDCRFAE